MTSYLIKFGYSMHNKLRRINNKTIKMSINPMISYYKCKLMVNHPSKLIFGSKELLCECIQNNRQIIKYSNQRKQQQITAREINYINPHWKNISKVPQICNTYLRQKNSSKGLDFIESSILWIVIYFNLYHNIKNGSNYYHNFSIKYLNFIFINHSIQLKSQNIQLMEPAKLVRTMKLSNQQVESTLKRFNFKLGYGQVSNTVVITTIGARVKVHIDMVTTAVILNLIFQTTLEVAQSFNRKEELVKNYEKYNECKGFGFLFGFFGMLEKNSSYQKGLQNTSYEVNQNSTAQSKKIANIISSLTETKVRVIGDIWVEGFSYLPSEAQVFIEVMTVKGRDQNGKTFELKVINHECIKIADYKGNVNGIGEGTLDIILF